MATESHTLAIDGEMTIYRAAELKPLVLGALEAAPALELSLAGVTELDTAGLQLLILAKEAALAGGRSLRLVDHSPAVLEVFELLGMSAYFGDAVLVAAAPEAAR
jgi:anti-sigma B factor antagonist